MRRSWLKLTHRDMGPKARCLGAEVPKENLIWQDPLLAADGHAITEAEVESLKAQIKDTDLTESQLVRTMCVGLGGDTPR